MDKAGEVGEAPLVAEKIKDNLAYTTLGFSLPAYLRR
jgi:hypothetical protein